MKIHRFGLGRQSVKPLFDSQLPAQIHRILVKVDGKRIFKVVTHGQNVLTKRSVAEHGHVGAHIADVSLDRQQSAVVGKVKRLSLEPKRAGRRWVQRRQGPQQKSAVVGLVCIHGDHFSLFEGEVDTGEAVSASQRSHAAGNEFDKRHQT